MSETEITNKQKPSQLLINNGFTAVPSLSNLKSNHPIQTYAFVDLETSGLSGAKITEFAVIAVSRADLEKMQTRAATAIPLSKLMKTHQNKKNPLTSDAFSARENPSPQNGNIEIVEKVRRQLFAAASNESSESDSDMARLVQVEDQLNHSNGTMDDVLDGDVSNKICVTEVVDEISAMEVVDERLAHVADQPSNKRSRGQGQEMPPFQATVDVATDTAGLFPRRWYSHYYKVPQLPRKMTKLTQLFNPKKLIYPATEDVSGLNNIDLEDYPILSEKFCNAFKEVILNLPKPVCLIAHYGEKCDFPIIMAEFLHATNCQFDWGDVVYADSLEVFKLLDKIETHLEIQEVKSMVDSHSSWFLDDTVFADPNHPFKRRCTNVPLLDNGGISIIAGLNPGHSELIEPQPSCMTSNAPCTPLRPKSRDAVEAAARQRTPKQVVMPSPSRFCPDTPVTPTSQDLGCSTSWSIRNPSPSPCGSLVTPPQTPVANRSISNDISFCHRRSPPSASKPSLIYFPPNCSFNSMVQIAMNHTEYNLGFPKYTRSFSQCNLYQRIFGRSYDAHRAEADCQALLQLSGHYGLLFTKTVDIIKRSMANIKPNMLTTRIVENLKAMDERQ